VTIERTPEKIIRILTERHQPGPYVKETFGQGPDYALCEGCGFRWPCRDIRIIQGVE